MCGVTTTGLGLCWGGGPESPGTVYNNEYGQTTIPPGRNWVMISPSLGYTCGVTDSGEGLCWGRHTFVPAGYKWTTINAGNNYAICGVMETGQGLCWSSDDRYPIIPSDIQWLPTLYSFLECAGITQFPPQPRLHFHGPRAKHPSITCRYWSRTCWCRW